MSPTKKKASASGKKRILIVDDHPMMRQGLIQLIQNEPDLEVCGEADTAEQGLQQVEQLNPDLVLADITLPGRSGIELIKDLQAIRPRLGVLVISMHDESVYAERVLRAGGRGYIMKQEGGRKLMDAIRRVLDGQIFLSDKSASRILEIFSGRKTGTESPIELLTDREFEVFQAIGHGNSTRQIAEKLRISPKTVEVHRVNIKEKLKIDTAPELIRYAVRWIESQDGG